MPFRLREQFELVRLLGRGAMGAVFRAIDLGAEPDAAGERPAYAVKLVQAVGGDEVVARLRDMFEHEAAVASLLGQSPYFVRVSGHGLGDLPYLVMEFVAWPTLKKVLEAGPVSPLQVARLGVALLEAVEVMHFYRVVHRDLKPSNLFVDLQGTQVRVKVADLGIWTRDQEVAGEDDGSGRLFVGTLPYMSPEQMACAPVGCRSDLHAVASILWEAATGRVPYPGSGDGLREQIARRRRACRTPPERPAHMPEALYTVLERGLRCSADERYQGAAEMEAELQRVLAEQIATADYGSERMSTELSELRAAAVHLLQPLQQAGQLAERVGQIISSVDSLLDHLDAGGSLDPGVFDSALTDMARGLRSIATRAHDLTHSRLTASSGHAATIDDAAATVPGVPPEVASPAPNSAGDATVADALVERRLSDHYERLRLIAAGSLARVYEGRQPVLDRQVALKVMGRNVGPGLTLEQQARLFRVQAAALARLQHPHTVRAYDLGVGAEGLPFLAMEYLEGETLADYGERMGPLAERAALALFLPIVSSLREAHALDVLHLNLKPRNIFLKHLPGGEQVPKVLSYGWPRTGLMDLLPRGMVLGTPRYMAPEQIRGHEPGAGSDLYAVGTMMYEALMGQPPYLESDDVRSLLATKITRPCVPLPERGPGGPLSAGLRAVVHALLARDVGDRPADAPEVLTWLRALAAGRPQELPLRELAGIRRRDLV